MYFAVNNVVQYEFADYRLANLLRMTGGDRHKSLQYYYYYSANGILVCQPKTKWYTC
jgi:hypothetical protein